MSHTMQQSNATLIDTTKCIGCRSCQATCKQWNELPGLKTDVPEQGLVFQNPKVLSAKTFTVVTFKEIEDDAAPGGLRFIATKRGCMHCLEPACASACPVTALHKTESGAVAYDEEKCLGCRYCMWACPFGAPTADWDSLAPKIHKCSGCTDRQAEQPTAEVNGEKRTEEQITSFLEAFGKPACVKQCPSGALKYGDRDELLKEAHARIAANPGKYIDHVYGENEAGGTGVMYLSAVPFEKLGLPNVGNVSYPSRSATAMKAVPPAVIGVGALLGGIYALKKRADDVHAHHAEFAPVPSSPFSAANVLMALIAAVGGLAFVLRFIHGLGGSTNLSDTYAWGLWIVFDLVWIAIAAGAFATAGIIYVFQRKDLYAMGRTAVLLGLLSYGFVTVTLLADLGLPWHFWQLAVQAPEHSAMFEVAWCVGLYVTILAWEFLPVPLERFGWTKLSELWAKTAPWYVVTAVTLFVYLMSRNLVMTAAAFAVFTLLAVAFNKKSGKHKEPIMLAIAAVTLSTMHQSSLGSLFLLMPDKLNHNWWSPIMPIYFFLSSIASGLALVILVEMWVTKSFGRKQKIDQLDTMGKAALIALAVYMVVRVGDLGMRGQLGAAFVGRMGMLLTVELVLGGIVPLLMLAVSSVRRNPAMLGVAAFLSMGGIIFNRTNVVILGMTLPGPIPNIAPSTYNPTWIEWFLSIGLLSLTALLISLGARFLPVLSKDESH
jgi:formate dehydrogenase iron-sulfur subunit